MLLLQPLMSAVASHHPIASVLCTSTLPSSVRPCRPHLCPATSLPPSLLSPSLSLSLSLSLYQPPAPLPLPAAGITQLTAPCPYPTRPAGFLTALSNLDAAGTPVSTFTTPCLTGTEAAGDTGAARWRLRGPGRSRHASLGLAGVDRAGSGNDRTCFVNIVARLREVPCSRWAAGEI